MHFTEHDSRFVTHGHALFGMRTLSAIASAQTDTVLSPSRTGDIFYVDVVLMPDY